MKSFGNKITLQDWQNDRIPASTALLGQSSRHKPAAVTGAIRAATSRGSLCCAPEEGWLLPAILSHSEVLVLAEFL